MKTIELSEVTALAPHLQTGGNEPIVVRSQGKTLAAVVPLDEDQGVGGGGVSHGRAG